MGEDSRLLSSLLAVFHIFEDAHPGVPQTFLDVATPSFSAFSHLLWASSNFHALASTVILKFAQSTNGELNTGLSYTDNTCCKVNICL